MNPIEGDFIYIYIIVQDSLFEGEMPHLYSRKSVPKPSQEFTFGKAGIALLAGALICRFHVTLPKTNISHP